MFGNISKTTFILVQIIMVVLLSGGIIAYDYFAPHPGDAELAQLQEDLAEQGEKQADLIADSEDSLRQEITDATKDMVTTAILDEEFEAVNKRLDTLEKSKYSTPTAGNVGLEAVMITSGEVEAARTYTWNITLTNRTDEVQLVHIKGLFIARTPTSTIDTLGTKMKVGSILAEMKKFNPSAANCIYMEISTVGDDTAIPLPAYEVKTVVVTLTLAYTSGSAVWDWSFKTQ